MSVELRITIDGVCECGVSHHEGYQPGCRHDVECDWGRFGDPILIVEDRQQGTVTAENVTPLILASRSWIDCGDPKAPPFTHGRCSFPVGDDGRRYLRIDADNGAWTWELFDAHWADGHNPNFYVGRWPD